MCYAEVLRSFAVGDGDGVEARIDCYESFVDALEILVALTIGRWG